MTRLIVALAVSLLAAATLSADTADLQAGLQEPPAPAALSHQMRIAFQVTNLGPNAAHNVRAVFTVPPGVTDVHFGSPWFRCDGLVCTVDFIGQQGTVYVFFYATAPPVAGRAPITMTVSADESDPHPEDNAFTAQVDVVRQPDLEFFQPLYPGDAAPDSIGTLEVEVLNAGAAATNAVATIDLSPGGRFLAQVGDSPFTCELAGSRATCRAPTLAPDEFGRPVAWIRLRYANPPLYGGGIAKAAMAITSDELDLEPRNNGWQVSWLVRQLFAVTNANDDGPGSLRQAILDANAGCAVRCVVDFRLPGPLPAAGFFTVRPHSPLPAATFYGSIDGATQADLLGIDATAPVVLLDGSEQPSGDGFTISNGKTDVTDLAVGRFPRFGIFVGGEEPPSLAKDVTMLDRVYAGVDPSGAPAPNFRGIVHLARWALAVSNSTVRHNRASGIVVGNGTAEIHDNRIEENGASGIYLANRSVASIRRNTLAHNHDFGVGVDALQRSVQITGNSIHDNGGGIDVGLDGPTPNVADDSHRQPNWPAIESAVYDEAKKQTIVTLHVDTRPAPQLLPVTNQTVLHTAAELYANGSPDAQAERLVAATDAGNAHFQPGAPFEVTLAVDGDLRGQWLTAITLRQRADCLNDACTSMTETSEISPPFSVR